MSPKNASIQIQKIIEKIATSLKNFLKIENDCRKS